MDFKIVTYIALVLCVEVTVGSYRHYHIENTDVCADKDGKVSVLYIGTGAVILQMASPLKMQQDYHKIRLCEIHLKAPQHFGIMAYIEEMNLRKNSKDDSCVDYVQFGQHDSIPFVTLYKGSRICGQSGPLAGQTYDDPFGNLLIWIGLNGRRTTSFWPEISSVNLTIVVTAYQADCGTRGAPVSQGFMNCNDRKKCIYSKYKCDKHVNCATDNGTAPADEMGCDYVIGNGNSSLTNGAGGGPGKDIRTPTLNWVSWGLIIVSIGLLCILAICLCVRCQRNKSNPCWFCCYCCRPPAPAESCEFPEQVAMHSLADLASQRHQHPTEQNIYLPLSVPPEAISRRRRRTSSSDEQQQDWQRDGSETLMDATQFVNYPEEAPPAYSDLFPQESIVTNSNNSQYASAIVVESDSVSQELDGDQNLSAVRIVFCNDSNGNESNAASQLSSTMNNIKL